MGGLINKHDISQYLQDYHSGKIKSGLDIGLPELDNEIRYKQGQLVIINGLDNVGKTIWMLWYFLCLSVKHNVKWCIYSGENTAGQLVRQLIQFRTGTHLKNLELKEIFRVELEIHEWFTFVDNSQFYKTQDLFKIFKESKSNGNLIDPFTGLDREFTHAANYQFLNECRQFCNQTKQTLYVNTHVVSEAARREYSEKSVFKGYPMPPTKSQSEGGQPFGNRTDDFITIHRLNGHPERNYITEVYIRKVKDTETGGKVTPMDKPIEFEFNKGLGFTSNNRNVLNGIVKNSMDFEPLTNNENFDDEPF
jgi:archaellum biogenesis ATPase FlaH